MRFACACLAAIGLPAIALAQQSPIQAGEIARARLLLHSNQISEQAWGAYFAGRLHATELNEDIVAALRSAASLDASASSPVNHAYLAALFDAAIESHIPVPVDVLGSFSGWNAPVLILLAASRDAEREDLLLRFLDQPDDTAWLTANNLLFGAKSQKWYSRTVAAISLSHRFAAVDPGGDLGIGVTGGGGFVCGDGILAFPAAFPPIAAYSLEAHPQEGSVVVAPGPTNAYYRRTVVPTGKQVGLGSCFSVNRPAERIEYLAVLAPHADFKPFFHVYTNIQYQDAESFRQKAQQALDLQEHGIRDLFGSIAAMEHLTAHGAGLRIETQLDDHRHNPTEPLPAIAPRDLTIE